MRAFSRVLITASLIAGAFGGTAMAQESKRKSLHLKDLPPNVQKTVQDTLKGGQIKTIGREKENGIEQYEIETTLNGKARDFNVGVDGRLLVVEEATSLGVIPAAAKAAILKKVGNGTLATIETFAKPGEALLYEAAYKDATGKHHEVLVNADGKEVKE